MKNIPLLLFGLMLLLVACGDDERIIETSLRYDGDNLSAPNLPPDTYETAARFPANITNDYVGQKLTQV